MRQISFIKKQNKKLKMGKSELAINLIWSWKDQPFLEY